MALYNMTGNVQALEQAQISTFSEGLGGTAFVANTLLQQLLPPGEYPGIYYMSQKVAQESLEFIRAKIEDDNAENSYTGYISRDEMLKSARSAWVNGWVRDGGKDIEAYFPGNYLSSMLQLGGALEQASEILKLIPSAPVLSANAVLDGVGGILTTLFQEDNVTADEFMFRLNSEGMWAGFVGVIGAAYFGKQLSDYEDKPSEYFIRELPDSSYKVAVSLETNSIVGVFDNTIIPWNSVEWLNALSTNIATALGNVFPLITVLEVLDKLTYELLPELRRHLSESYTAGFNGDYNPLFVNSSSGSILQYPITNEPSSFNETIWSEGGYLGFLHSDTLYGSGGDDRIFGGDGADELYGDDGSDIVYGQTGDDTLYGGLGSDTLRGGDGDDLIYGGVGNDVIDGDDLNPESTGNDTLHGEDGDDQLSGGHGDDLVYGGNDNDTLAGADGNDTLHGDDGDDYLDGGVGNDDLRGGAGKDSLYGMADNDTLNGEGDTDMLYGGKGEDHLYGGDESDHLSGGDDSDFLFGEEGDDALYGDEGDDQLTGGKGNDTLVGGKGNDRYEFHTGDGFDQIIDSDGEGSFESPRLLWRPFRLSQAAMA